VEEDDKGVFTRSVTNGLLARHLALVRKSEGWTTNTTAKEVYSEVEAINGKENAVLNRAMLSLLQYRFARQKWDKLAKEMEQQNPTFPPTRLRRRGE
jgi:hypothetical protein